jgi:hypothetical protein
MRSKWGIVGGLYGMFSSLIYALPMFLGGSISYSGDNLPLIFFIPGALTSEAPALIGYLFGFRGLAPLFMIVGNALLWSLGLVLLVNFSSKDWKFVILILATFLVIPVSILLPYSCYPTQANIGGLLFLLVSSSWVYFLLRMSSDRKNHLLIAVSVVLLASMVSISSMPLDGPCMHMISTGFSKIKPQMAGSSVSRDGAPRLIFTNGVGTNIELVSGKLGPIFGSTSSCSLASDSFRPYNRVPAGENVVVSAGSCLNGGPAGAIYSLPVKLTYRVSVGGITDTRNESGAIRGYFE